jgi:hypothetical protein
MINLDELDLRTLQKECSRVVATMEATNNNIYKFNQQAFHDSQNWYKSVISWYIDQYGDLPSRIGPGKDVVFVIEN